MDGYMIDPTTQVAAVVISHDPDGEFPSRIEVLLPQVAKAFLVDNGSREAGLSMLRGLETNPKIEILYNSTNLGLAAALNQGIAASLAGRYPWILTLDQDSQPGDTMVQTLLDTAGVQADPGRIGIVAPVPVEPGMGHPPRFLRRRGAIFFERAQCNGDVLEGVTTVFNSGALHPAGVLEATGGFREDLFIDYVDTEYCLRLWGQGYRILVVCRATLGHQLGARTHRRIGPFDFFPTFHSPVRWYYISRNRVALLRGFALRDPHWTSYELTSSFYIFLRMLLFEDSRIRKLTAAFAGTRDGLRGRMGEIPPALAERLMRQ
jgi:rhamnosyltransferase